MTTASPGLKTKQVGSLTVAGWDSYHMVEGAWLFLVLVPFN